MTSTSKWIRRGGVVAVLAAIGVCACLAILARVNTSTVPPSPRMIAPEAGLPYAVIRTSTDALANIKALVRQKPPLVVQRALRGPLHIDRLMRVSGTRGRGCATPSNAWLLDGYFVADVQGRSGRHVARFALTCTGYLIGFADEASTPARRALALDDATAHAALRVDVQGAVADYVYPGLGAALEDDFSILRPVVRLHTRAGTLYMNSAGETFAEAGTALADNMARPGARRLADAFIGGPSREYVSLGMW